MVTKRSAAVENSLPDPSQSDREVLVDGPMTVGERLKALRLERKKTILQISKALRIGEHYLEAIENNDLSVLPEQVYTLGFVKSYAKYLGQDSEEIVAKFKNESSPRSKSFVLDFPAPVPDGGIPRFTVLSIATIFTVVIYALWYFLRAD